MHYVVVVEKDGFREKKKDSESYAHHPCRTSGISGSDHLAAVDDVLRILYE